MPMRCSPGLPPAGQPEGWGGGGGGGLPLIACVLPSPESLGQAGLFPHMLPEPS